MARVLCRDFICRSITLVEKGYLLSGQVKSTDRKSFPFCNQLALRVSLSGKARSVALKDTFHRKSNFSLGETTGRGGVDRTRDLLCTRLPRLSMTSSNGCPKQPEQIWINNAVHNGTAMQRKRFDLIYLWQARSHSSSFDKWIMRPTLFSPCAKSNLSSLPSSLSTSVPNDILSYSISLFQWSEIERSNRQQFNKLRTDRRRVAIHLHDNSIKWSSPDSFAYENLRRSSGGVNQFSLSLSLPPCITGKETKSKRGNIITSVTDNKCILIMRSLWLVKTK